MVLIIEVSNPFQLKPGIHHGKVMTRVWWLWFAVAMLHVRFEEFTTQSYGWRLD